MYLQLKMLVGSYLDDTKLQKIVKKTISDADSQHVGKMNFASFSKVESS
jgi:hypothetical protein